MTKIHGVIVLMRKEHTRLTRQIEVITAALAAFGKSYKNGTGRRTMSAAGRARIAAAKGAVGKAESEI